MLFRPPTSTMPSCAPSDTALLSSMSRMRAMATMPPQRMERGLPERRVRLTLRPCSSARLHVPAPLQLSTCGLLGTVLASDVPVQTHTCLHVEVLLYRAVNALTPRKGATHHPSKLAQLCWRGSLIPQTW